MHLGPEPRQLPQLLQLSAATLLLPLLGPSCCCRHHLQALQD
jgi:hypothetical protein